MLKQSPSRNLRSKGFKVKHALQICVLLAICIWLLYQVKHSHDKKKPYEENSLKLSEKLLNGHDILKLGRKGFRPRLDETASNNGKRREEEEEEESKIEENEDEARGGGDDEIDGHDQGRSEEEEYEQGEDLIDVQDEEREEGSDEQEIEENENNIEDGGLLEDQDHNRVQKNSQEAREEHYKRDDASSAVVHNTQTISTETGKIRLRKVKEEEQAEIAEKSELDQENLTVGNEEANFDEIDSGPNVGDDEAIEKSAPENSVGGEEKGNEFNLADTDVGSDPNSSTNAASHEEPELNSSSTLMQVETHGSLSRTGKLPESLQDQNVTSNEILSHMQTIVLEQNENSNITAENESSNLDSTLSTMTDNSDTTKREKADSSIDPESVSLEQIVKLDTTDGTEESSASTTNNDIVDAVQNESFDSSDSSFYQEDRVKQEDLVTIQEIEIGTSNGEDADE